MTIAALIEEAKQAYAAAALDCGDGLLPPAADAGADIRAALGLVVPPDLLAVYRVHGGQEYISPGVTGLFGQHRLHAPAEVVENYQTFSENCLWDPLPAFPPAPDTWGYWVPQLLPFASWDAYDLCVHTGTSEVWEFIPNTGLIRHRPGIAAVLEEVIAAVKSGGPAELGQLRGPK